MGNEKDEPEESEDRITVTETTTDAKTEPNIDIDWKELQQKLKNMQYPEIKGNRVSLRGDEKRAMYSLAEDVLFESGKADLKPDAKEDLQQIAASLKQRYAQGKIYIYGHTDSEGNADQNEELSRKRAEAVKQWLITQGQLEGSQIAVFPKGERNPAESNETPAGRQQNRRVDIVAVNK